MIAFGTKRQVDICYSPIDRRYYGNIRGILYTVTAPSSFKHGFFERLLKFLRKKGIKKRQAKKYIDKFKKTND